MTEYTMPRSALRYRPIYNRRQVKPVAIRTQQMVTSPVPSMKRPVAGLPWSLSFLIGMFLTFAILVVGHLHF